MKNLLTVLACLIGYYSIAQQTETRTLRSFRVIKVSQAIDTYLKKGESESVRIEIKNGKTEDVVTDVEGTSLRIKMREGKPFQNVDVKVYVTYVNVERISASSAASVFSEGVVKSNHLDINVSSAANVEISVEANSVMVDASSAGEVALEGKTTSLETEASSAGNVNTYRLESENVNANCSSGADIKLLATKELEAHVSSGGSIRYRGNPSKINTHSSSGGSIKKSN